MVSVVLAVACAFQQAMGQAQSQQKDEVVKPPSPARVVTGRVNPQRTGTYAESGIHSLDALAWKSVKL